MKRKNTLLLEEVSLEDVALVGGKSSSLGEMIRNLAPLGINIPSGFAITSNAYWSFIEHNGLKSKIRLLVEQIDMDDLVSLRKGAMQVRQLICDGYFPPDLQADITNNYLLLSEKYDQYAICYRRQMFYVQSSS